MKRFAFLLGVLLIAAPAHTQAMSVWIDDLTWPEVRDAIAAGKQTAIIYVGSSEQNGPHMVIGKHNFIARALAQRIAEELGDALAYPVLPYAVTGNAITRTGHMRFPGSVSLPPEVFFGVVRGVAQSALAAGFKVVASWAIMAADRTSSRWPRKNSMRRLVRMGPGSSSSAIFMPSRGHRCAKFLRVADYRRPTITLEFPTPRRCSTLKRRDNGSARTRSPWRTPKRGFKEIRNLPRRS